MTRTFRFGFSHVHCTFDHDYAIEMWFPIEGIAKMVKFTHRFIARFDYCFWYIPCGCCFFFLLIYSTKYTKNFDIHFWPKINRLIKTHTHTHALLMICYEAFSIRHSKCFVNLISFRIFLFFSFSRP